VLLVYAGDAHCIEVMFGGSI